MMTHIHTISEQHINNCVRWVKHIWKDIDVKTILETRQFIGKCGECAAFNDIMQSFSNIRCTNINPWNNIIFKEYKNNDGGNDFIMKSNITNRSRLIQVKTATELMYRGVTIPYSSNGLFIDKDGNIFDVIVAVHRLSTGPFKLDDKFKVIGFVTQEDISHDEEQSFNAGSYWLIPFSKCNPIDEFMTLF